MNLGWKLGVVLRDEAPDSLLDSCHDERHPAGADALTWSTARTEALEPGRRRVAIRDIEETLGQRDILESREVFSRLGMPQDTVRTGAVLS